MTRRAFNGPIKNHWVVFDQPPYLLVMVRSGRPGMKNRDPACAFSNRSCPFKLSPLLCFPSWEINVGKRWSTKYRRNVASLLFLLKWGRGNLYHSTYSQRKQTDTRRYRRLKRDRNEVEIIRIEMIRATRHSMSRGSSCTRSVSPLNSINYFNGGDHNVGDRWRVGRCQRS